MSGLFPPSRVFGPPAFEAAWSAYPDRHIAENKRDALRQWIARIKEGVPEVDMLEGARRYRTYTERLRIAGTEYVMQPRRFFGPSRHFELPWQINGGKVLAQEQQSQATMKRLHDHEAERLEPAAAKAMIRDLLSGLKK